MLKQFVPSDYCLKCLGCCRFAESPTIWAPAGCSLVKNNEGYHCGHLNETDNHCKIYKKRPLDCRLYPFLLVKKGSSLSLGLHKSCCFVEGENPSLQNIRGYADYLKKKVSTRDIVSLIKSNPRVAVDYQGDVEIVAKLPELYKKACLPRLKRLTLQDKPLFDKYLRAHTTNLSAYHFVNIYIWKDLFQISWAIIEDSLCVFYQDAIGIFMILPPLGKVSVEAIKKCFEVMNWYNQNSEISRIENVDEKDLAAYTRAGFKVKLKDTEYIYVRKNLAVLVGNTYKHKRASCNHFSKYYKRAEFLPYRPSMFKDCLGLYNLWMAKRKEENNDALYQQMIEDSMVSFNAALKSYRNIGLRGYVVKVDDEIKACSFGYPLHKEMFCILFEVCDLQLKGAAQFIFREFCRRVGGYTYINSMGISDLDNLKKVKLSYRPLQEVKSYSIYQ